VTCHRLQVVVVKAQFVNSDAPPATTNKARIPRRAGRDSAPHRVSSRRTMGLRLSSVSTVESLISVRAIGCCVWPGTARLVWVPVRCNGLAPTSFADAMDTQGTWNVLQSLFFYWISDRTTTILLRLLVNIYFASENGCEVLR